MDGFPLQPYDVLMLAVLVMATIFGAWKGMAWQLASLASVVVSAIVALQFGGVLGPLLSDAPWGRYLAMLILYLLTSLAIWLAFRLVSSMIDRVKLQEFDHQIGALFGLAKGILLCLVITFFAVTLSESTRQMVLKTYSGHYMTLLIQNGTPMLPENVRDQIGSYLDQFNRKLTEPPHALPDEPAAPEDDEPLIDRARRELMEPASQAVRKKLGMRFPGNFGTADRT